MKMMTVVTYGTQLRLMWAAQTMDGGSCQDVGRVMTCLLQGLIDLISSYRGHVALTKCCWPGACEPKVTLTKCCWSDACGAKVVLTKCCWPGTFSVGADLFCFALGVHHHRLVSRSVIPVVVQQSG